MKKEFYSYSDEEQKQIKRIQAFSLMKEIEIINCDKLDDETHTQLMIYVVLFSNPHLSYLNKFNTEYTIVGNEIIEKTYTVNKKIEKIEKIKPDYIFERKEYKRKTVVEGKVGIVNDYEEYVNSKTYYEYSYDSYERKNWRTIEYKWKNYIKEINI